MTKILSKQPIIINENDFIKGIANSSIVGMQQVQNIDIFNVDGTARAGFEMINGIPDPTSTTFTANAANEQLTLAATFDWVREGITFASTGRTVQVSSSGTLPAGLTAGTNYIVSKVSATVITLNGVNITDAGTGTHTITSINPRRFEHYATNPIPGTTNAADQIFAQDSVGKIWAYGSTSGWTLLTGNSPDGAVGAGLAIWKNYLVSFKQTAVDLYGPLDGSPAWSNNWAGVANLNIGNGPLNKNLHKALVGQDDILYYANINGNIPYVGSLLQKPGTTFDPANAATYTWNAKALDLPNYLWINDLEELGLNLMIATVDRYIYPWDRVSDSFDLPIISGEPYITALKTLNNTLYYACGIRGNIYRTYGTTSVQVNDFSDQLSNVPQSNMLIDDMQVFNGYLLFSASGAVPGVYVLDVNNNNRYILQSTVTNASGIPATIYTSNNPNLYNLNYIAQRFFVSWSDNYASTNFDTVRGCDSNFILTNGPYRATGDIAYFISPTYFVGDDKDSRTFEQIELTLLNPITSGQSVKISSRVDNATSFSNEVTFSATSMTSNGGLSGSDIPNIVDAFTVQLKVILSLPANTGATSQYNTPLIKQIKVS